MSGEAEDVEEVAEKAILMTGVLREILDRRPQGAELRLRAMSFGLHQDVKPIRIYQAAAEDVDRLRLEDQTLSHLVPEHPLDIGTAMTLLHHRGADAAQRRADL